MGVMEGNSLAPASAWMNANICVPLGWTFPAAEMVKGSRIKSGTIPFRYKQNDLIVRAMTQAIE